MKNKALSDNYLKKIQGGSNDGFWERYGTGLGAYTKCSIKSFSLNNPICTAKGIYAGIKG